MYYVLECFTPDGADRAELDPEVATGVESWMSGVPFPEPLAQPLELRWEADSAAGARVALYDAGPVLMRRELVAALAAAGVNNLDVYEAVVRSSDGAEACADYLAVNVVGLIAAADMERSEAHVPAGSNGLLDVDFDSLVIDAERARGALLFRLGECVSALIVHRSVREHLESLGGFGLTFVEPEEWCG